MAKNVKYNIYYFSLKNLNIGSNEVGALKCPRIPGLPNLTELNLINNKLESFVDVMEIGDVFPGIETLVLSDNPLCSFGDNEEVRVTCTFYSKHRVFSQVLFLLR